jgi:hypothetical protein
VAGGRRNSVKTSLGSRKKTSRKKIRRHNERRGWERSVSSNAMLLLVWQPEREDGMNECGEEIDNAVGGWERAHGQSGAAAGEWASSSMSASSADWVRGPVDGGETRREGGRCSLSGSQKCPLSVLLGLFSEPEEFRSGSFSLSSASL